MNPKIKIVLYVVLLLGAAILGALFYSSYQRSDEVATTNYPPSTATSAGTNVADTSTNTILETNAETNLISADAQQQTNAASTHVDDPSLAQESITKDTNPTMTLARPTEGRSSMIGYLFGFVVIAIFLGLLIARDISEYFGSRSVDFMFNDEGTGIKNPEYEEAEQVWANGNHLEAIRMMREYLTKNPREQYVALRIAEIYEKDLKNPLAAVLEYEEVLKSKLPPERWGWAAIHLCNLYTKMNKTDEAVALLHRIVNEYGQTAAAKKARERLGLSEIVSEEPAGESSEATESEEKQSPASNLPPGFRPKK